MALQAISAPVADVAVVVGKTPRRESMQGAPSPAVVERRGCPMALNARPGLVTHPAFLGIECRGWSVTAQPPERRVAFGQVRAMASGAGGRGVTAGARAPRSPGLVLVPGQIGVRAQPELVVIARLEGSRGPCHLDPKIAGGVALAAVEPG